MRDAPMRVDRDFAGRQIIGKREDQQDNYAFSVIEEGAGKDSAEALLIAIADGMGGYEGGGEASQTAVKSFIEGYFKYLDADSTSPNSEGTLKSMETEAPFSSLALAAALGAANGALDNLVSADPDTLEGAGTTMLGVVIGPKRLQWISVGDSPLFLWRKGELKRLNADHSMRSFLAQKVAARQMPPGDLATHPERNVLRSALLGGEIEEVDAPQKTTDLFAGDIIIACTDGLLSLEPAEIAAVISRNQKKTARELVDAVLKMVESKKMAKQDNATVAVVIIP